MVLVLNKGGWSWSAPQGGDFYLFVAAGVTAADDDLGFGDPKMVGEHLDKRLIGGAINRFFSEVDRQFRGVCRIGQYERAALGARFNMDEVKHNYDVGGTSKVSDRAGQGRAGV